MRLLIPMLMSLCALSGQAWSKGATAEAVPLVAWAQLDAARAAQSPGMAPQIQVIFDPYCPASANLYRKLAQEHPGARVRWIPIAYYRTESVPAARDILAATDGTQAMHAQFERMSRPRVSEVRPGRDERGRVNPAVHEATIAWGGFTPMVFGRTRNGSIRLYRGHYADAIELALRETAR